MTVHDPTIGDQLSIFLISLFYAVSANYIAYRKGFFHLPSHKEQVIFPILSTKALLSAFLAFLLAQIILVPLTFTAYFYLKFGDIPSQENFDNNPMMKGWFNVLIMMGSWGVLMAYTQMLQTTIRKLIWGRNRRPLSHLLIGAGTWFLAYPLVLALGQAISLLNFFLFGIKEVDQAAVQSLKMLEGFPVLYFTTAFIMFTFVPVCEELLFRGFLQTWLKGLFGARIAIIGASIIFALFHFSFSQGVSNLSYLAALTLLSAFLGFLYEKRDSLLAPIALHATFNAASLLIISLS